MKSEPSKRRLLDLVERFERVKVLAVVDLVADEYVFGRISRVSREAPVLILDHDRTQLVPGGGANAVANIKSLGGRPLTVGLVGKDASGRELLAGFRRSGISTSAILRRPAYQTPTKTRILAGGAHSTKQQVVRIDRNNHVNSAGNIRRELERAVMELLPKADVVMVSDYGYGLISPELGRSLARRAAALRKLAILDSRYHILDYPGFAAATPNEPEVEAALGLEMGNDEALLERAGRQMLRKLRGQAVVMTRGSKGMMLFEHRRPTCRIPVFGTDEVADVTGAGDTVISTFTLALGAGATFYEAALLANYAGSIVVMKRGTATASREELAAVVGSDHRE
ncbi:MAG TPA: bifunctional ADP-heptose synthase [Vicinamibacteria bacterium]|nr:bifunctional ADP-heptose synthase [Vicinamibacteria bacterium]